MNCDPPIGWEDNRLDDGAVILGCTSAFHDFAPQEDELVSMIKLGATEDGMIRSPQILSFDVDGQFITVRIDSYIVHDLENNKGPVTLDIGVQRLNETSPIWLVENIADERVDPNGMSFPYIITMQFPTEWSSVENFQVVFRLQNINSEQNGYSAGFEIDRIRIGNWSNYLPLIIK